MTAECPVHGPTHIEHLVMVGVQLACGCVWHSYGGDIAGWSRREDERQRLPKTKEAAK